MIPFVYFVNTVKSIKQIPILNKYSIILFLFFVLLQTKILQRAMKDKYYLIKSISPYIRRGDTLELVNKYLYVSINEDWEYAPNIEISYSEEYKSEVTLASEYIQVQFVNWVNLFQKMESITLNIAESELYHFISY